MKANRFYPNTGTCIVLLSFLLAAASLQAQTFTSRQALTDSPAQLEAVIFPVSNQPNTIRVNFNNRTAGAVRVVIKDAKGQIYYNELEVATLYRRSFDLCSLPTGAYTVELSKSKERFAQTFVIEPSVVSHITMQTQPGQQTPNLADSKKLVTDYK